MDQIIVVLGKAALLIVWTIALGLLAVNVEGLDLPGMLIVAMIYRSGISLIDSLSDMAFRAVIKPDRQEL